MIYFKRLKKSIQDFDITSRHISNIVRDNNITLKLTRFRHEPTKRFGKDININKNIKLFYEKVKQYKIYDIICIVETSIKSLQKRKFCYSRKGKRCVVKTHSQEVFKKYTGIFAISTKGVLGCTACDKFHAKISTDYEIVKTWDAKNWEGIRDYVMLYKLKE